MDFTIKQYIQLLNAYQKKGYQFQTFAEFLEKPLQKLVILRHDVDDKKFNSLAFAKIQAERGIRGSYYFRMIPQSYDVEVIKEMIQLGHEIGYHYEDMDFAFQQSPQKNPSEEELYDKAYSIFVKNLNKLRQLYPVKTVCMHGSPRSSFDNKAIWKKYKYKELGIIGEPYYDIDFNEVFYLTDTGRRWDGYKVSIRDKVDSQEKWIKQGLSFHTTTDIIAAINGDQLPDQIMMNFHPQRWNDNLISWTKELVLQRLKNIVKWAIVKSRK